MTTYIVQGNEKFSVELSALGINRISGEQIRSVYWKGTKLNMNYLEEG